MTVRRPGLLKQFLAAELGISLNRAKELIDRRNVLVNNQRVWIATHRLNRHDVVEIPEVPARAERTGRMSDVRLPVLYQDDSLLAVNKPPGIVSDQAPDSVEQRLRESLRNPAIRAIHRLDRDTSGVMLLAKDTLTLERFKGLWAGHQVEKTYRAICFDSARFRYFTVDSPVEGRPAMSRVTLLRKSRYYSYFEVTTRFGRKHQVRVHLNSIHHPVVGDTEYGPKVINDRLIKNVPRQMLHCWRIRVLTGPGARGVQRGAPSQGLTIIAGLPGDFRQVGRLLGLIPPRNPE